MQQKKNSFVTLHVVFELRLRVMQEVEMFISSREHEDAVKTMIT